MTDRAFPETTRDSGTEPRFYFRVLDDLLFVFDREREMAHALNAPAARLFLSLPDAFTAPAALGEAAALGPQDLHDCLAAWGTFGWTERDEAGRVRLKGHSPPDPDPPSPTGPAPGADETLIESGQVRLAERSVAFRLLVGESPTPIGAAGAVARDAEPADADMLASRLASGRRMFGFFGGFLDPLPDHHPPVATIDLVVSQEGFLLRCGARLLFSDQVVIAVGKARLWLLDLAYRDPRPSVFVHGAGLATDEGSMVLAGVSGAGKSTLSAYLVTRGWRFATDDSLALGFRQGETVVLPFPGAINIKPGSLATLLPFHPQLAALPLIGEGEKRGRYLPVPLHLHLRTDGAEKRVRGFVFPRFEPGAPLRVEPLSAARALLELMEAEFDLAETAGAAELDAFFDTLERLPRYAIVYSNLAEMEAALRRLVAGADA
ncbi:hypothetical protein [Ancylobacter rudongensis]|uniref:HprK-related kinase B n=1 Tax=Ancylobacter rudongensis TaxID=177413 RepID=A0A1G4SIQ3_9HYPH|nr:hypothetical protein [Ancylobacter rudongensis]SCW68958.1 hypothetical protein SAMN05660859_2242 [Ancylobacter rudongensis]